jgi:HAD superfamily hydrolase (TIGR01459 family)
MKPLFETIPARVAAEGEIAFITGLAELAPRYDVILCDVWGVLHDGIVGFPAARDALARFRAGGGTVVLVSNAPRPGHVVEGQLERLDVVAHDAIVTSGDLTRKVVIERQDQSLYHLGPDRDLPIYDGVAARFETVDKADYVVCTGLLNDDTDTLEDYAPLLQRMRERDLWMLCANPDIVVERGERLLYCAGALAAAYEQLGGRTYYPGKPHLPIYEEALDVAARLRGAAPEAGRVLAIGDAIRTDVAGGRAAGLDVLMIVRGIHAAEIGYEGGPLDPERVKGWLNSQAVRPTAIASELTWD